MPCVRNPFSQGADELVCQSLAMGCLPRGGTGPLTGVWQRPVTATNESFRFAGWMCRTPTASRPARPAISISVIRSAFARTPLPKPVLLIQPPGGLTLVRLPTYFQAASSGAGYGPGQVHAVTLLGRSVRIRVASVTYAWSFGDGTPPLKTASAGGPWPDGDVRHAYPDPGTYSVRVTASYHGEYSVDGGPWVPIDAPVPVTSPPVTLTVATAHNRLIPD